MKTSPRHRNRYAGYRARGEILFTSNCNAARDEVHARHQGVEILWRIDMMSAACKMKKRSVDDSFHYREVAARFPHISWL